MAQNDSHIIIRTIASTVMDPIGVFNNMNMLTKGAAMIVVLCLAGAAILAVMRRMSGGERSSLLATLGTVGLWAGIAGAAYNCFVTWQVAHLLGEYRFPVLLPSIIETVMVLVAGLLAWAVAGFGNAGAKR